jgi:hypothetical protein
MLICPFVARMELFIPPDLLGFTEATSKAGVCALSASFSNIRQHSSFMQRITWRRAEMFPGGGTIRS